MTNELTNGSDRMIGPFKGRYAFLSNFYPSLVVVGDGYDDDFVYDTVEHAYQAAKTLDVDEREMVQEAATPGRAKHLGRRIHLRSDWDQIKITVMRGLLQQKFGLAVFARDIRRAQSSGTLDLRKRLLATRTAELVELNTWGDGFWGRVSTGTDHYAFGRNELGKLLMEAREEIRKEEEKRR